MKDITKFRHYSKNDESIHLLKWFLNDLVSIFGALGDLRELHFEVVIRIMMVVSANREVNGATSIG